MEAPQFELYEDAYGVLHVQYRTGINYIHKIEDDMIFYLIPHHEAFNLYFAIKMAKIRQAALNKAVIEAIVALPGYENFGSHPALMRKFPIDYDWITPCVTEKVCKEDMASFYLISCSAITSKLFAVNASRKRKFE